MQKFVFIVFSALVLLAGIEPCFSWGRQGHRIVAQIAASELSPLAEAQTASLLGAPARVSLVDVSDWADRIRRSRRETGPWHYVDIEVTSQGYSHDRDCADDDCVVGQIDRDIAILRNRQLDRSVRAEALRFLVHFVGDLHQPLHCADDHDRGGNGIFVILGGHRTNMHAVWDRDVVGALNGRPEDVANSLAARITPAEKYRWSHGTVTDWANESFWLARSEIYSRYRASQNAMEPIILPPDYARREAPVAAGQLARAGVRLATILNRTFATR
jgi:hypothetical protein